MKVGVVIPARDEEETVGGIVSRCLSQPLPEDSLRVVVCDNGSSDGTARSAVRSGAEVVRSESAGYGRACRSGIEYLEHWPDILLFLDADGSSLPEEIPQLLEPIRNEAADLVVGCRTNRACMTGPQRWGTWLASRLLRVFWSLPCSDIGPFRAIRADTLEHLGMEDQSWGWTVEMQILAAEKHFRVLEVPVSWKERLGGCSKISGSFKGVLRASARILWTFVKYLRRRPRDGGRFRPGQGPDSDG